MMTDPWESGDTPAERAARREAYQRLVDAARRVGLPLTRLADLLHQITVNEEATRRFLARDVYGVPDDLLDDFLRLRLDELDRPDDG